MSSAIVRCTKTQCQLIARMTKQVACYSSTPSEPPAKEKPKVSARMAEFQKKLRQKSPMAKLEELTGAHPYQEKEPLKPWPNSVNPYTGEIGGPAGPEPTRYGDWERKGRVTDF